MPPTEPTERELTVAVDDAALHTFARVGNGTQQPIVFDRADPMLRLRYRDAVAPVVHDAPQALTDRAESAVARAATGAALEIRAEQLLQGQPRKLLDHRGPTPPRLMAEEKQLGHGDAVVHACAGATGRASTRTPAARAPRGSACSSTARTHPTCRGTWWADHTTRA